MTCFLNMNLLFLSPWRLIPPCTCSVTPAGAAGICKHSWCVSASERSHLTSPRRSSPRMPRITRIHKPGHRRSACCWCRLIRGAQGFCQTVCWKSCRNEVTQGAGYLVHFFRPCETLGLFTSVMVCIELLDFYTTGIRVHSSDLLLVAWALFLNVQVVLDFFFQNLRTSSSCQCNIISMYMTDLSSVCLRFGQ